MYLYKDDITIISAALYNYARYHPLVRDKALFLRERLAWLNSKPFTRKDCFNILNGNYE